MVTCAAYGCTNRSGKKKAGVTFHKFPKDAEKRKKWTSAVRRKNWEPTCWSFLCSEHFRENDINRTSLSSVRIRENAVPSIFPAFPAYLQSPVEGCQRKRQLEDSEGDPEEVDNMSDDAMEVERLTPTQPEPRELSSSLGGTPETPTKRKLCHQVRMMQSKLEEKSRKLKAARQTMYRLKKRVASMEVVLKDLRKRNLISEENDHWLSNISEGNKDLLKTQCSKINGAKKTHKYSPAIRAFALTLHFYSPKAYNHVRKFFDSCLPHPRTISRWYENTDFMPGFSREAKDALHAIADTNEFPLLCSLVVDEMAIKKQVEFDGKRSWGYVDYGGVIDNDAQPHAKEAYVLLLTCININWKVPMGYFLIDGLSGGQRSAIIVNFLQWVHHINVKVISLTFDGAYVNTSMANSLGCDLNSSSPKTFFLHPVTQEPVHVFLDPCHMLKLVRNAFGEKKEFLDGDGGTVKWAHIDRLVQLQEKEGLHLGNKLRMRHINFQQQKMKVRLAVQLLSASVADALEYCGKKGLFGFEGVEGTVKFLRIFNRLFDILNSRSLLQKGWKKPMVASNLEDIDLFFKEANEYISSLRANDGVLLCSGGRKTGFMGFKICMASALGIYRKWVEGEKVLKYMPLYKVSQDHIELLFGCVRSMFGCNNNPSSRQFMSALKKIVVQKELQPGISGNCIGLEHIPILGGVLKSDEAIMCLNSSGARGKMCDMENSEDLDGLVDHDYPCIPYIARSEFQDDVVSYIAGFIVRKVEGKLKCEQCLVALRSDGSGSLLLQVKDRGGLVAASSDVVRVCKVAERVLRQHKIVHGFRVDQKVLHRLGQSVLKLYGSSNLFASLREHVYDQPFENNHVVVLIKLVAHYFFKVRLHYEARLESERIHKNLLRHKFNKLVHFKGQ